MKESEPQNKVLRGRKCLFADCLRLGQSSRRWYLLKFGKGGKAKLHEDDLDLCDPGSTEEASGPCIEVDEDSV